MDYFSRRFDSVIALLDQANAELESMLQDCIAAADKPNGNNVWLRSREHTDAISALASFQASRTASVDFSLRHASVLNKLLASKDSK